MSDNLPDERMRLPYMDAFKHMGPTRTDPVAGPYIALLKQPLDESQEAFIAFLRARFAGFEPGAPCSGVGRTGAVALLDPCPVDMGIPPSIAAAMIPTIAKPGLPLMIPAPANQSRCDGAVLQPER